MALKLNIGEDQRAGAEARAPLAAPLGGYPADSSGPRYRHSAAHDRSRQRYSAGEVEELLANAVFVVMSVERFWLWRVVMT